VPYVKISRDKRGYETYYLLEPSADRSRQSRPRILFWFRTPPQVKVGREPFSEEIRQAIESQNPNLTFDWPRLMAIQPPPVDVQRWRERRRLERAARQAARADAVAEVVEPEVNGGEELPLEEVVEVDAPRHSIEAAVEADPVEHPNLAAATSTAPAASDGRSSDGEASPAPSRRRRRRRRRRHGPAQVDGAPSPPQSGEPPPSNDEV
jgi:hypothetical protein